MTVTAGASNHYLPAMPPRWVIRLSVFVRSTRTGQLLSAGLGKIRGSGARESIDEIVAQLQARPH